MIWRRGKGKWRPVVENASFSVFESGFLQTGSLEPLVALCERDPMSELVKRVFPAGLGVLEAGAGDGRWVVYLSRAEYDAVGIEYSAELCSKFNCAFPELHMEQGDLRRMPFEDNSFDGVVSFGAIEHVPEGPECCIREIARVLRPGSKAILTVPNTALFQRGYHAARDAYHWLRYPGLRSDMKAIRDSTRSDLYCFSVPLPGHAGMAFFEYRMSPAHLARTVRSCGMNVLESFSMYPEAGIYNTLRSLGARYRPGGDVELTALGGLIRRIVPENSYNHMACVLCEAR